ncbi:MAG: substrate-binding domain-containing protein [Gemmiger sp.]|nr:substrate-binding domain-containing protein [Gemmiger sp.]MDY5784475.1 substrate-binding domain-containing protein [Gemmiger sp.]
MKKRTISVAVAAVMALSLAACGSGSSTAASSESTAAPSEAASSTAVSSEAAGSDFDATQKITVVSREDGSGTRGAFVELTGVEEKNDAGEKVDNTTVDATVANSTNNVMQTVQADETAIGYISMGSLNDTVKAVQVDGVDPTADNVKNGSYTLARPFNIVTKGETTNEVAADFISYIMGADGQAVISDHGYIGDDAAAAFTSAQPSGKIVVAGSSSVSPVMEKLIEAYKTVNPNAEIELQTSDSTTGVNSAIDGTCDIGMASRELKDSETGAGAVSTAICMDGIAVIVNNDNPLTGLTKEQIKGIYVGEVTEWSEVA